jgi:hypothetical protein
VVPREVSEEGGPMVCCLGEFCLGSCPVVWGGLVSEGARGLPKDSR